MRVTLNEQSQDTGELEAKVSEEIELKWFGFPVRTFESVSPNAFWMTSERGANAIKDHDAGIISEDDRDAILGEELFMAVPLTGEFNA
jgi:hypothetical protein